MKRENKIILTCVASLEYIESLPQPICSKRQISLQKKKKSDAGSRIQKPDVIASTAKQYVLATNS